MSDDAYQATAGIKSQEIVNNEQAVKARPKHLHDHAKTLSNAVMHLNKQTERGEHAPDYNPAETQVS